MYRKMMCIVPRTDEEIVHIRNAGFEYAELTFSQLAAMTEEQVREHLDFLDSLGFKYVAANGFFGSTLPAFFDGSFDVGLAREYIAGAFEKTKMIRWESIAFGSGFMRKVPDGYPLEKAYEFMAQFIKEEIVPCLDKYDAYLNIEELNSKETNFINTCRDAVKLVKMVDHPRVGILCDFYHMSLGGETYEDVQDFVKYIGHVHIASPSNNRYPPHENDGDGEKYTAFFDALKAGGYKNGSISVEGRFPENCDFEAVISRSAAYLQREMDRLNEID